MDGKMDTWTNQRLIKLTNQLLDGQMSTNGWIYKKKKQCLGQKRKKSGGSRQSIDGQLIFVK